MLLDTINKTRVTVFYNSVAILLGMANYWWVNEAFGYLSSLQPIRSVANTINLLVPIALQTSEKV